MREWVDTRREKGRTRTENAPGEREESENVFSRAAFEISERVRKLKSSEKEGGAAGKA